MTSQFSPWIDAFSSHILKYIQISHLVVEIIIKNVVLTGGSSTCTFIIDFLQRGTQNLMGGSVGFSGVFSANKGVVLLVDALKI